MNDGTIALLIQWSLLCLVWMGSMDAQLQEMGLRRKPVLAFICAFLLSTFVSWKLYFAPVEVSLSGMLLPFIASVCLYARLPVLCRLYLVGACATAILLFWLRWLFFIDPVLLFWDERVILPTAAILSIFVMSRHGGAQLFQVMVSLPLADLLYSLFMWKLSGTCRLGDDFSQDLLWSTVSLWTVASIVRLAVIRITKGRKTESASSNQKRG
ncbi:hypothetical protein ACFSO0_17860 [Brevibacillus sp. GCM10020057]|uniref:YphA family membrane protein n=1 Tax=Brevibacillus sp. GCM10020057 TaxID=3317327 RepID=UPI00362761FF